MNQSHEKQNPAFYALMAVLVFMSIGPVLLMLVNSFKLDVDIISGTSGLLFLPTIRNYETALSRCCWSGPGLLGGFIRESFGGRGDVCLAGTHGGIILIYVALNLPFVIWILQSFIVQVPRSLEEAARVDGAGPFQVFFTVVLPLIKPGLAAAAIFTFRIAWNEYLLASALSDRDTRTVPILIVNNMSEFNVEWGVIMATGMLLAIPPIIFTLVASRQIITGMTAGAVKG